ncbi:unnamed protein product [Cyclocybe aegerita]|uniref:Uncharacterized protein n=1 Tax=Cyclocybe aegerita TaxID=1973307 RepID=A0A8S0XED1_CYCAE|nr:unnamed protein product [Cyclocybe aegerita]
MTLFSNPIRSAAIAAAVVSVAHFSTKLLTSLYAFQLTQTSIAILSISALLFMIMMHHKSEGQMLTRSQEEMAVIGLFALFWVVFLVGYKSMQSRQGGSTSSGKGGATADLGIPQASKDPCAGDNVYCIYEEYTYW